MPTTTTANNVNGETARFLAAVQAKAEARQHEAQEAADAKLDAARAAAHETRQAADAKLHAAASKSIGAFFVLFDGQFSQLNYQNGKILKSRKRDLVQSVAFDVSRDLRFSLVAPNLEIDPQSTAIIRSTLDDFNGASDHQIFQYDPSQRRVLKTAASAIVADPAKQKLFWIDSAGVIRMCGYDGSKPQTGLQIDRKPGEPCALAIDSKRQLLYCLEPGALWKISISGWKRSVLASPAEHPEAVETQISAASIAVNEGSGYVYWSLGGDVEETRADGSTRIVATPSGVCYAIAIEPMSHTLYWANGAVNRSASRIRLAKSQLRAQRSAIKAKQAEVLRGVPNALRKRVLQSWEAAAGATMRTREAALNSALTQLEKTAPKDQIHRLYLGGQDSKIEALGVLPGVPFTFQIFVISSYAEAQIQMLAAKHQKARDLKTASNQVSEAQTQAANDRAGAQRNFQAASSAAAEKIRTQQVAAAQQRNAAKRSLESQRTQARQTKSTARSSYQTRIANARTAYDDKVSNAHQEATKITAAANAKLKDAQKKK